MDEAQLIEMAQRFDRLGESIRQIPGHYAIRETCDRCAESSRADFDRMAEFILRGMKP